MKFREHEWLIPIVANAATAKGLELRLEELSAVFDFVDLQYSTTTLPDGGVHYSALILATKKQENAK